MKDELVTLITLTYAKAQVLKSVLESEGIMSELYNVNIIQPFVSSGVKVCVNAKDVEKAMAIIEAGKWLKDTPDVPKTVLVPVDFSDYSLRACYFAFDYAAAAGAHLVLFHVYFPPVYSSMFPSENDVNSIEEYQMALTSVNERMATLVETLNAKVKAGELPDISFESKIYEGVAEEEIIHYASRKEPLMIVMGTRGKGGNGRIVGGVTEEVIERSNTTVVAIPQGLSESRLGSLHKVAFLTNLDRRDLISFDSLYEIVKVNKTAVTLLHVDDSDNRDWKNVKISGLRDFFSSKYPDIHFDTAILPYDESLQGLNTYIAENGVDAISLARYRRSLLSRIVNPSFSKKLLLDLNKPLIVFNK